MTIYVFNFKVVQQRKTFARTTCARTEECVSASGVRTAATAQPVMEARIVNKVRRRLISEDQNVCVYQQ